MGLTEEDRQTLQDVDTFITEAVAELELSDDSSVSELQVKWDALFTRLMYPLPD